MGHVLGALALAVIGLALLIIVAPILLVIALVFMVVAWRLPAAASRVSTHPRLAPVPSSVRSTPMRFASALVAATIVLTVASVAIRGPNEAEPAVAAATPTSTATASPSATPDPTRTERPTARPTPRPTRTPSPEPTPVLGQEPTGSTEIGLVVNIVDGDTIDVLVDGVEMRVRYIGMDTPEVHSGFEWLGAESSAANARLVEGKEVVLEKDVSETDQYGRALRYVWLHDGGEWLLVNLELIRLGFAVVTTYPPDVKYVDDFYLPAQEVARDAGLGQWGSPPTPAPTPVPPPPPPAPTAAPILPIVPSNCEPSYPGICIPIGSADLDCGEIQWRRFQVRWDVPNPDPHRFDGDRDGIGCES